MHPVSAAAHSATSAAASAGPGSCRAPRGRLLAIAVSILLAATLALAGFPLSRTALGSCASPLPVADALADSEIVVVATVTELQNGGRWAFFRVEERWRGHVGVPDEIQVRAGPGPGEATAIDRVYTEGRYLLFLAEGAGVYVDNICSSTQRWTDDLAVYRPSGVEPAPEPGAGPPPSPLAGVNMVPVAALAFLLVIALWSYAVILRSRRRPPGWKR